mgnify:CR=1 FL=1
MIVDKKIKSLVQALNKTGIPTTSSCEGHINRDSPVPWIKITAREKSSHKNSKTSKYWQDENKKIRLKTQELLKIFYKDRKVSQLVRITTSSANTGFWIHNGKILFHRWRRTVNERVKKIKKGGKAPEIINRKEKIRRVRTLPPLQKEMASFAKFLMTKRQT